jgi:hypothetical protein
MVADNSVVSQELVDVTGLVSGTPSVAVNGVPVAVTNGLFNTAIPLVPGSNEIRVTVTDISGKTWNEVRTVTKVSGAPALSIAASDVQVTENATLALSGSVDAGVYVAVSGIPAEVASQKWNAMVTLTPGLNTIEVQAIDLTGQTSTQKRTVFYSPTSPALAITAPGEDVVNTKKKIAIRGKVLASPEVTVNAEVNGKPMKVTVDGGSFSLPVEFSEEGVYTITVSAGTAGGSVSTVSRTVVYRKKQ